MRAGPVRQGLRPGRLGVGEVRRAEHADEYLRLADFPRRRIDNRDPFAGVVHEPLVPGDVMLAHHRRQASLEPAQQVAKPAVAVALPVDLPIFLPWQMLRICLGIIIVTPGRFSSRASPAHSGSTRRRWPVAAPARPNSRRSRTSSVTSSANGHATPAAPARFRFSWCRFPLRTDPGFPLRTDPA